jgi:hypothetical protein
MTHRITLTITSLFSALLATFHLADDVVRGFEAGGPEMYIGMLIAVAWLYATLVLAGRRLGLVLILLLSIGGAAIPYIHMSKGLAGGRIAGTSGMFFWVWTLIALGVTSMFSIVLSARGLWSFRKEAS